MQSNYHHRADVMTAVALLLVVISVVVLGVFMHAQVKSIAMWCAVAAMYTVALAAAVLWSWLINAISQGTAMYATFEKVGVMLLYGWVASVSLLFAAALNAGM